MKKRATAAILAACMTASMVAGCSAPEPEETKAAETTAAAAAETTAAGSEAASEAETKAAEDYKIGLLDTSIKWKLGEEHNMFGSIEQFAEVGEGVLDFPAIIPAGLDAGIQYFLLEQDETYGKSAFDSLAVSRDNLIRMGYGDWF